jgi:hypothetical protein
MSNTLSAPEMAAVSALNPQQRMTHLIGRVADWEEIWSLSNADGWVLSQSPTGEEAVPIWPHPDYAKLCAQDKWEHCQPAKIALEDFMAKWIPGLTNDQRLVNVFPTATHSGLFLVPSELFTLLKTECEEKDNDKM